MAARGVRTRQSPYDRLAGQTVKYHAAPVDREVAVSRAQAANPITRCRKCGERKIGTCGNRVQLQVILREVGARRPLNGFRPPRPVDTKIRVKSDDRVLPHRISVKRPTDERKIVQVRTACQESSGHRYEGSSDGKLCRQILSFADACDGRKRNDLIRVPGGGYENEPTTGIVGKT
jgi:hypothetical protein